MRRGMGQGAAPHGARCEARHTRNGSGWRCCKDGSPAQVSPAGCPAPAAAHTRVLAAQQHGRLLPRRELVIRAQRPRPAWRRHLGDGQFSAAGRVGRWAKDTKARDVCTCTPARSMPPHLPCSLARGSEQQALLQRKAGSACPAGSARPAGSPVDQQLHVGHVSLHALVGPALDCRAASMGQGMGQGRGAWDGAHVADATRQAEPDAC